MRSSTLLPPLLTGIAALVLVVACQRLAAGSASTPSPVVHIDTSDFAFAAPDSLPSGNVTLRLTNAGQEPHHAQLLRLRDGISFEQLASAAAQGPEHTASLATPHGGPGTVAPNGSVEVTVPLQPGTYALVCYVPSPDGQLHSTKGMMKQIQVLPTSAEAQEPTGMHSVTMSDFAFEMPEILPAGSTTLTVTNVGPQPHELALLHVAPGTTPADLLAYFQKPAGPPPFQTVGGLTALDLGQTAHVALDLQPGSYAAVCLVPEPTHGVTHLELGMVQMFTVSGS